MSDVFKNKLLLYADDSGILVSCTNKQEIEQCLSGDLACLIQWLSDNNLSLHLGKTNSIFFGAPHQVKSNASLQIQCNMQ